MTGGGTLRGWKAWLCTEGEPPVALGEIEAPDVDAALALAKNRSGPTDGLKSLCVLRSGEPPPWRRPEVRWNAVARRHRKRLTRSSERKHRRFVRDE